MIKSCKTNFKSRLLPSPRLSEDVLLPILRLYALATLDTDDHIDDKFYFLGVEKLEIR